jgi:type I restriction enzyme S subunit
MNGEWSRRTLRELATINYGRDPSTILDDDGDYPVYGTSERERLGTAFLYDGDSIVLGRKGSIGRVQYVTGKFWTIDTAFFLSQFKNAIPKWLFYFLASIDLRRLNEATGVPSLSRELLYQIKVSVPPRNEQAKIVEILSAVDQVVAQTEALIAKQTGIKTGLIRVLLSRGIDDHGNLRSPRTHEFKDSLLGIIPVKWDARSINDLTVHVGSGITPRGGDSVYTDEGVLFIRSQNVHFGGLRLDDVAYIPRRIHSSMSRSEVFTNDVLLNITGASIGRCCAMPALGGEANVNQHVCAIRLRESTEADAGLLAAILESNIGQRQISQYNAGGNREGLNYQQVRSFLVPWPQARKERETLFRFVREAQSALDVLNQAARKLQSVRTALMQDLLCGRRKAAAS